MTTQVEWLLMESAACSATCTPAFGSCNAGSAPPAPGCDAGRCWQRRRSAPTSRRPSSGSSRRWSASAPSSRRAAHRSSSSAPASSSPTAATWSPTPTSSPSRSTRTKRKLAIVLVSRDGEPQPRDAELLAVDKEHDLALLRISGDPLPALKLGDSASVREGQMLAFTGFPIGMVLGFHPATHRGMVAAITPVALPGHHRKAVDRADDQPHPRFGLPGVPARRHRLSGQQRQPALRPRGRHRVRHHQQRIRAGHAREPRSAGRAGSPTRSRAGTSANCCNGKKSPASNDSPYDSRPASAQRRENRIDLLERQPRAGWREPAVFAKHRRRNAADQPPMSASLAPCRTR